MNQDPKQSSGSDTGPNAAEPASKPALDPSEAGSPPTEALDIVEVEPGAYSVIVEGRSFSVVSDGSDFLIDGVRVPVPPDPRDWTGDASEVGAGGPQKITSPMPGRIVSVLVQLGDEVETGAGVAIVEAMKMQNEMKAKQAGKVTAIHVKEGATVAAGEVLVTIE